MSTSTQSLGTVAAAPHASGWEAAASRAAVRWLKPSFSDCFFIALIAWLFIYGPGGWQSLLADGDAGWHIRAGQYILKRHAVPTHDLFSFSPAGAPWFAWEWLSDVAGALLFQIAGLKAIVLAAGVGIALFATVLLRYTLWLGTNALVALVLTLAAVGAASMHFLARPHLFTLLLLPSCLWLVQADRREKTRWVWALIPVTVLWTNLHGGFVVFLACLALLVIGCAIEMAMGAPRRLEIQRYSALLAGCSLASLVNPYGVRLHAHIFEYLRSDWIRNIVQEFQAPTFRSEGQFQFELLLLGGLIVAGILLRRGRWAEALWILFLAHSSLTSVRHAPLYASVAAPLVAYEIGEWWQRGADRRKRSSAARILYQLGDELRSGFRRTSVWPLVFVLGLASVDAPLKWPRDFPGETFPVGMVNKHANLIASGRLLAPDQWGDYIIYRFYPRQKVYVDGRSDFYGEKLGGQYLHLLQGAYDAKTILDRNGFDVALLPVDWPLASMLKLYPSWRVIDDDSRVILFRRAAPAARKLSDSEP